MRGRYSSLIAVLTEAERTQLLHWSRSTSLPAGLVTRAQARTVVLGWIEVWYNRKRRHSALGYVSPDAFERQHSPLQPAQALAA